MTTHTIDLAPIHAATRAGWNIGENLAAILAAVDAAIGEGDTETANYWGRYIMGIADEAQDWMDENAWTAREEARAQWRPSRNV